MAKTFGAETFCEVANAVASLLGDDLSPDANRHSGGNAQQTGCIALDLGNFQTTLGIAEGNDRSSWCLSIGRV